MNDYEYKINQMVWSYSRLSTFEQCRYSFYLKYIVENDDEYLAEGNYWAEVGSFMHEILERVFKGEMCIDDAAEYFVNHYDDYVLYDTKSSIMEKTYDACLSYLEEEDLSWLDEYEVIGVELEVEFKIEGHPFKGFIDLLLKHKETGELVVLDHKSAAYPLSSKTGKLLKANEKSFISYKKQMYLYCNAVNQLYGRFPKWIVWNHFKAQKFVTIPFDQKEYDQAIAWFVDTIQCIREEKDFPETMDYFYCHNLCEFRNSCEYKLYEDSER